jgi:putative tricarboxylic transport membrane protein
MRKRADALAGIFFALVGIVVMTQAIGLGIGTATDPKPGFFPLLGGLGLTVISTILLVRSLGEHSIELKEFGDLWRPLFLVLGLGIYILTLDMLGYIIATVILSAIVLHLMDTKPWWALFGISLGLALSSYFLFDRLLGVILPKGILIGLL